MKLGKSLKFFGESVGVKVPKKRTVSVFGKDIGKKKKKRRFVYIRKRR